MNPHVNAIAGRLSLRPPQRRSLEILGRVTEIAPPAKGVDVTAALAAIRSEFRAVTDFERDFPSLCFALATGVGKTRLMGAFISYLHLAHGIDNFFVLAPNLTIYRKLIADFTPGTDKYVFRGIAAFATTPPEVITGDNYESRGTLLSQLVSCKVNIFNISKINTEVRGGRSPRIKRLSEYIGQSYFDYLAGLPDLVLLMDESHRYRASAGIRAINELKPVLGLELTATPFVEASPQPIRFKNVIFEYSLANAMADGFVKEPAVVTRKDFSPPGTASGEIDRAAVELIKLEDGIRLHEQTKVTLETYARENGEPIVKPFVLVIARDTSHARQLRDQIEGDDFFAGRYAGKVIQVDSSGGGPEKDETIDRLLKVESTEEPTEIVIHVNMLKEGWDVTNLYTIIPLRAANARTLIEQSIGRGLRLPYGKRTGVAAVDRLNIVAHDRFQELVDEANAPGSVIRLQTTVLDPAELQRPLKTVVSQSNLALALGFRPASLSVTTEVAGDGTPPAFARPEEQAVAQIACAAIQRLASNTRLVPRVDYLTGPDVQERLLREVSERYRPEQPGLAGFVEPPDIAAVVAATTALFVKNTIDIPRITVAPRGEIASGFSPFELALAGLRFQPLSEELWLQYLRTNETETLSAAVTVHTERRPEDYVVSGLIDFDDVAYDSHADLLYDLAGQAVRHFRSYLSDDDTERVLRSFRREIADFIHAQMQSHYWETGSGFDVVVRQRSTSLRDSAYTRDEPTLDFRHAPADKSHMARYLFGGFERCLYPVEKFQSDPERLLAVILERESQKWFKPAKGQFQLFYRSGSEHLEYQPDFVAETTDAILMLEPKMRSQMEALDVVAKRDAAILWCQRATDHAATCGGKPWSYVLIPHDAIAENQSLTGLAAHFTVAGQ